MSLLAALPLLLAASPTLDNRSEKVIDLFVQVCLRSEARFARGDVDASGSVGAPWAMGGFNRQGGRYYRVRRPVEAWIAVIDEPGGDRSYSRTCRVGARYVEIRSAADRIRAYLRQTPLPRGEEYYLDGGAKFEIKRPQWVDFVTLTSYVLTPEAAAKAKRKWAR